MWRSLNLLGVPAALLHSFLTQKARVKALDMFRNQQVKVLITTDVAARGVDVKAVDLVIHYNLPNNRKDYIHRVGRCVRGGKEGLSICMVTQYDVEKLKRIEEESTMGKEEADEEEVLKHSGKVLKASKQADIEIVSKGEQLQFEKLRLRKQQFREQLLGKRGLD